MSNWKARLSEKKLLVLDGAWGTELAKSGLASGVAPERWNIENPDAVRAVAKAYVDAGSDIILTNTFGGSQFKLAKSCADLDRKLVNREGARLSRDVAADRALVFASVGPTGEFMEPLGTITEKEMIQCFADQIAALAEGGVDGIVIETMSDLGEARAALRAAREVCSLPVAVSMTYQKGPARIATMMGVTPEQAAEELDAAGADIIGANCGAGIGDMIEVVRALRRATGKILWTKPNAGLPQLVNGETVFRETPEEMACSLPALVEAGASLLGGCCGTTPDHIHLFAQEARNIVLTGVSYLTDVQQLRIQ